MLFAARKLRLHPALKNPTVMIVVDRIDLDSQISSTFYAADTPNLVKADSRAELQRLLTQDVRKIIITTIFKFGEAGGVLNDRSNIIAMVDEAHRTQEGDLGRKMREALPNAFLFGLTGTPINRADRNTFYAFGAEEDKAGYMSRYGFEESIRDGATMPLHFEPRLLRAAHRQGGDRPGVQGAHRRARATSTGTKLAKTAAKMAVLVKSPERIERICADIARHFQEKVAPNGFGAQVVTFDRESCVLYKQALDEHLPPEMSDIVMTVNSGEDEYAAYRRDRDAEEKLLDRFRDPADPLKILIVTSKLLTGFDAPILQAMYLDKPLRDHTLLQAICRTNRPYGEAEDARPDRRLPRRLRRCGAGDPVRRGRDHPRRHEHQRTGRRAAGGGAEVPRVLPGRGPNRYGLRRTDGRAGRACRTTTRATASRPTSATWRGCGRRSRPIPSSARTRPTTAGLRRSTSRSSHRPGTGRLLWHALGPKTIELIHEHVHVDAIRDDLETLVLDADLLEAVLGTPDPGQEGEGDRDQGLALASQARCTTRGSRSSASGSKR